jgi:hypothetical protein
VNNDDGLVNIYIYAQEVCVHVYELLGLEVVKVVTMKISVK